MTSAERVRTLVTQAWAEWHLPPPAALVNADPVLVAAEFKCDRIEAAVRNTRGTQT